MSEAAEGGKEGRKKRREEVICLAQALVIDVAGVSRGTTNQQFWAVAHGQRLQTIVIDVTGFLRRVKESQIRFTLSPAQHSTATHSVRGKQTHLIQSVRQTFEISGDGRDFFGGQLIAVREVTAVRQVQRHQTIVRLQDSCIHFKVGRRTRQRLDVHTPLFGIQTVHTQCALLTQTLRLIDELIATIIATQPTNRPTNIQMKPSSEQHRRGAMERTERQGNPQSICFA